MAVVDEGLDPLVVEAAATGLESLRLLERRAAEVALDFRWRRFAPGRRGLAELVSGIQSLVTLAVSAADRVGCDLDHLCGTDGRGASEATRRAVNDLIGDQAAGDWSALANTIERRLIPALDSWRNVFGALVAPFDDPDPFGWVA
jgi:hypothetical protein